MHAQHVGDPQQRRRTGIHHAGLDALIRGAADTGGKEHRLLGAVLAEPLNADAVADGASAFEEPGVVVGQVGHPLDP